MCNTGHLLLPSVVLIWLQEPAQHCYYMGQPGSEVCLQRLYIPLPKDLSGSSEGESSQSLGTLNNVRNGHTSNLLDIPAVSYTNIAALVL